MKILKIKNINENKGAATALVLVTILSFIIILSATFTLVSSLLRSQMNSNIRIQQFYSEQVDNVDSIYNEIIDNIYMEPKTITQAKQFDVFLKEDTILIDDNNNNVMIPKGFKIASDSGTSVAEGIVIEDQDIIEGIGNNRGNQYVWIPVGTGIKKSETESIDITLGRYTFAEDGTEKLIQSALDYINQSDDIIINNYYKELTTSRNGVVDTNNRLNDLNETALDLKGFLDSVKQNGGYYIARYESSYGVDGKANSKISNSFINTNSVEPTTEGQLWNNISQIDAVKASRNIYGNINNIDIKTDLINSYAWDTAIVYIQKFSGDADYSIQKSLNTTLANTGLVTDEKCKINDMASNIREWTTEYSIRVDNDISFAYPCVIRGAEYNNANTHASNRYNNTTTIKANFFGFRTILYV